MGGFSTCFKDGVCYEDDDLLFKIKHYLKLNILSVALEDDVGVVHLFHGRSAGVCITPNEKNLVKRGIWEKFSLNKTLFDRNFKNNRDFPTPKIFHYYWDDFSKFNYLNLYSLKSSVHYHKDFLHVIWCPIDIEENITWNEYCNKTIIKNEQWGIFLQEIKKLNNVKNLQRYFKLY